MPSLANKHLVKLPAPEADIKHYQSAVGALMYPALCTRPDMTFTVASLGHHSANPSPDHLHALDCTFRYLHGTSDTTLIFQKGNSGTTLCSYVDANWASDINDRKSTSGFIFFFARSPISWSSKKQTSVTLSSTEAKYIAAAHTTKEALWLRHLLTDFGIDSHLPTTLYSISTTNSLSS
jgi:hypothetical protein